MARILVVEDDVLVGRSVSRLIGTEHHVTVLHDVEVALELTRMEEFDLVISDIVMPRKNGMDLHAAFVERGISDRIVFLTGAALSENVRNFLSRIPNRWLEKPCSREALLELVNTELAREHAPFETISGLRKLT